MSAQYYLPQETARLLTSTRLQQCKNLGLLLDKYIPQDVIEKSEKSNSRSVWLKQFEAKQYIDDQLAEQIYQRWLNTTRAASALHFSGHTDWRMVVGLGGETVLETDMTLHHLYGIPFIPGSALKGLTRAYVTKEIDEYKSKKIEDDKPDILRIFGSQNSAGTVVFFDAMPINGKVEIDLDIMNAHYPKYYGEKQLPTNTQNPNPVTFLTVTNTTFMFAIAPRRPGDTQHQKDVQQVRLWLQSALQDYGVGGKTSAGYGALENVHDEQQPTAAVTSIQHTAMSQQQATVNYIRPNIPTFRVGQEISPSTVVTPTDEMRRNAPADTKAFLRFREFPTQYVLIIVNAEEAMNWKPGERRGCLFQREEVHNGCTVIICQPKIKK